ncbi:MAG: DUF4082 domain-containing protein, partial [Bacteroidota bacterium]|nr:DUF4082 domain-containing protein [Bacteroidota bacterium]
VFQLSLNGGISKALVTVTAKIPPPDLGSGSSQTVVAPLSTTRLIEFTANEILGYSANHLWTFISGPNRPFILSPTSFVTDISGLVIGEYVIQSKVTGQGGSDSVLYKINVIPGSLSPNIFTTQIPTEATSNAGQGIEVGVKFKTSLPGYITGIRFYKTSGNTGTHTGELYSSSGTRLAQAVFTNETVTGWQTVVFGSPVAILANTTYVAAYFSPAGTFTSTSNFFANNIVNNPLTALRDGDDGPNGVFNNSTVPVFPAGVHPNTNNYWVDVVYSNGSSTVKANAGPNQNINEVGTAGGSSTTLSGTASSGTITSYSWTQISGISQAFIANPNSATTTISGLHSASGSHGVDLGYYIFQLSLNGGESVSQVTLHILPLIASAGADQIITLPASSVNLNGAAAGNISSVLWTKTSGPNNPTITNPNDLNTTVTGLVAGTYTFQLSLNGGATNSQLIIIVNPATTSIFTTQKPVATTDNDHKSTVGQELGVKFTSSITGFINGVRFYKTSGNTGTHIGELYSSAGVRLAQATFANETATGWQTVRFTSPIPITANTTYTAAYFSSLGNYVEDNDYFLHKSVTNSSLTAPSDGTNGGTGKDPGSGQGTYKYTSSAAFPNQLYRSANYWVDVIFATASSSAKANAGPGQIITLPASLTLDGSGSTGASNYLWSFVSGPNIPIIDSET